jgi:hypothetical protein
VLSAAGVAAFIVFLGALRATLRRAEGEAGALSALAVIAGSVLAAAGFVETALHGALAFRRAELDVEVVMTLFDAASLFFVLLAFPAAVLVAATSAAAFATRALPRALGYVGFAVAVLQLPAGASVAASGVFSPSGAVPIAAFAVYLAWVAATSLAILTGRPRDG